MNVNFVKPDQIADFVSTASRRAIDCIAMVIAFDPAPDFPALVETLRIQFAGVVVVDNGNGDRTAKMLGRLNYDESIVHLRNDANLGIGAALNRALDYADEKGHRWLVTFDHDSRVQGDYAARLFDTSAVDLLAIEPRVAIIGPVWERLDGAIDFSSQLESHDRRYVDVPSVITSGSCVNVASAKAIGGFDETLFIDSVDQEFCLRARSKGHRIVVDRELKMTHRLGAEREVRILGCVTIVTNHSAVRRYYISRNKSYLWRAYFSEYPKWVITDIKWYAIDMIKVLLFESNRSKKAFASAVGFLHAFRGIRSVVPMSLSTRLQGARD